MDRQANFISIWLQLELCALAVLLTKGIQNLVSHYLVLLASSEQLSERGTKFFPTDLRIITLSLLLTICN